MKKLISFFKDEEGATAIEYGLIAALLSIAILITVTAVGTQLNVVFNKVIVALGGTAV